ncbi:DUF99 family protein [Candidatus Woesearchaeota archaeon]|nr:DUF99 family protein [Candidatus Woesearchaeota archaeon]
MKKEVRVVGIDDSPFDKFKDKTVFVIGAFYRGGNFLDGVLSTNAEVDGSDSTEKIALMINNSKFKSQLRAIFLDGIAVGGFNVVDVPKLNELTGLPVIVVVRDYPDFKKIFSVLKKIGMNEKIEVIKKLGKPVKIGKIYVQHAGISSDKVKELLKITCTRSFLPEPIRVAHLIAAGVVKGESRGRA